MIKVFYRDQDVRSSNPFARTTNLISYASRILGKLIRKLLKNRHEQYFTSLSGTNIAIRLLQRKYSIFFEYPESFWKLQSYLSEWLRSKSRGFRISSFLKSSKVIRAPAVFRMSQRYIRSRTLLAVQENLEHPAQVRLSCNCQICSWH